MKILHMWDSFKCSLFSKFERSQAKVAKVRAEDQAAPHPPLRCTTHTHTYRNPALSDTHRDTGSFTKSLIRGSPLLSPLPDSSSQTLSSISTI